MECNNVRDKLIAYLDNELDKDENVHILLHLESCESCNQEFLSLLKTNDFLSQYEDEKVPDDLVQDILRKTSHKITIFKKYHFDIISIAASILLFFSLGMQVGDIYNQNNTDEFTFSNEIMFSTLWGE